MPAKSRRVLRLPEVMRITGFGQDSIYRGGREGWFPRHIKIGKLASGWFEDEIQDYLAKCAAARDANTAPRRAAADNKRARRGAK